MSELIFEMSKEGRCANAQLPLNKNIDTSDIPKEFLRQDKPGLPELSELDVVRHFTKLSQKNYAVDTVFYPLGSCTMKYNPHILHTLASLPEFLNCHPLTDVKHHQGLLSCLYDLQEMLKELTGMSCITLTPAAGAQGEFAGIAMIRAYHQSRNDTARTEIIVPDSAHGTNPASAAMCGYTVKEVITAENGDIDIEILKAAVGPQTAGIMLTNPSTLGVFEQRIEEVAQIVHDAGGLLYYDGANINAILGRVRPGDMHFDVIHLNVHKTFGTPHGCGGPGGGPVAANDKLKPFLPIPFIIKENDSYRWSTREDVPESIGHLSVFMGNVGVMIRAYVYMRMLGREGMPKVAEFATLNSNYLMKRLMDAGFTVAQPTRRASHEFIVTLKDQADQYGVTARDYGKRLLDYSVHAPTTYFPLIVPECLLIEPTETESKETLDYFVDVMVKIKEEAQTNPELVKTAPHTMPIKRLDEVKAARELNIVWKEN